ncbi:MAG: hypothetical protein ACOCRK_00685 [bacterium]
MEDINTTTLLILAIIIGAIFIVSYYYFFKLDENKPIIEEPYTSMNQTLDKIPKVNLGNYDELEKDFKKFKKNYKNTDTIVSNYLTGASDEYPTAGGYLYSM